MEETTAICLVNDSSIDPLTRSLTLNQVGFDELFHQGQEILQLLEGLTHKHENASEDQVLLHTFASFQLISQNLKQLQQNCTKQVKKLLPLIQSEAKNFNVATPFQLPNSHAILYTEERPVKSKSINDQVLNDLKISDHHRQQLLNHPDRLKKKSDVTLKLLTQVLGKSEAKTVWTSKERSKHKTFIVCKKGATSSQDPLSILESKQGFKERLSDANTFRHGTPLLVKKEDAKEKSVSVKQEKKELDPFSLSLEYNENNHSDVKPLTLTRLPTTQSKTNFDPFLDLDTEMTEMKNPIKKEPSDSRDFQSICENLTKVNQDFFDNPLQGVVPGVQAIGSGSGQGQPEMKSPSSLTHLSSTEKEKKKHDKSHSDKSKHKKSKSKKSHSDTESDLTSSSSEEDSEDERRKKRKRKRDKKMKNPKKKHKHAKE